MSRGENDLGCARAPAGSIDTHLFRGVPSLAVVPAALLVPLVFVYWEQSAVRERLGQAH